MQVMLAEPLFRTNLEYLYFLRFFPVTYLKSQFLSCVTYGNKIFIVLAVPAYYFVNTIVGLWKIGSVVDRVPGPKKNWLKGNLHQVAWDPIHKL